MKAAAAQGAFLLREYQRCFSGLEDRHRAYEPSPGTKTAGWLVGHLVVTGDFARKLCGLSALAPKDWRPHFAPGSSPSHAADSYPPMGALIEAYQKVYTDLTSNAPAATAEALALPNPFEPARGAFPTAGSFAVYLMTGHLGYHLGQLSLWRAAAAGNDPGLRPA